MNTLEGEIKSIHTNGSLSLIKIKVKELLFSALVVETPDTASYLKKGNSIKIIFKETEVIIGKGKEHPLSIPNKIVGHISMIEKGEILSKIIVNTLVGELIAIITSEVMNEMVLEVNEEVTIMIKTSEIMLSK